MSDRAAFVKDENEEKALLYDEAYLYAKSLFKHVAPQCEPMDNLPGLMSQLDNYIAGRDKISQEERREAACATEAPITPELLERLQKQARLVHAFMGMMTEIGEFTDMLKKHIFYNKPLDEVNLKEEIADLDWYVQIACSCLSTTLSEIQATNIKKLRARFPEKFSEFHANNRNLDLERSILEK